MIQRACPASVAGLVPLYRQSLKSRPAPEILNALLFRPLGFIVARSLWATPIRPIHLVLLHTLLGSLAAVAIACRYDRLAAVLLQLVTVLDNADGQFARLTRQETELGRYADTELDALKNAALLGAIAWRTKRWVEASVAFLILTFLLSWDFNVEYLYRSVRGESFRPDVRDPDGRWVAIGRAVYRALFSPQDAAVRRLERWLYRILTQRTEDDLAAARVWWNRDVVFMGANLGLTTQYVWLGLTLLLRTPGRYLRIALLQGLVPLASVVWRSLVWTSCQRCPIGASRLRGIG
ncbi:CDP-alcohol phosphatidyltransferase family protein [Thermomicrobium sp. 4228-Ro]|uniref:CDP-alcohol phosphatidyltransferase family protein n=1 Tax=Thermomicrobium sp. 4228-Ro TaxID=2993937 RepID=UPI002248B544|nr:CDP-alcohol phosphatidyltransferase family protein [Thermomicrobium sp. 4228-Ro]MCX2727601.1 CDP-alcohol phosphatidyltransferase family protein [Thermomicrobium sp. 4228-Ro]